jgi:hypothetical protein
MSISNDLIERTNKLFERIKYDPEFQYTDDDFETKDLIVDIDKGEDDPDAPDDINLVFTIKQIKVIKNINSTPNLVTYPYFLDFLPMRMIENEINYFIKDKQVTREQINMMLFEKESINNNKNIKFIFPKNCISNIPNKLYINEFGRELVHLTIHYIHSKVIDKLITNNLYYDTVIKKLEKGFELIQKGKNISDLNSALPANQNGAPVANREGASTTNQNGNQEGNQNVLKEKKPRKKKTLE